MSVVITRLFDTYEQAAQAVAELERSGIPHSDISIVANNAEGRLGDTTSGSTVTSGAADADRDHDTGTGAGTGATIGTVLGGGAGLLAGLGMLAIPGVGPVVAAGWLIATAVGAGVGAGAGGLLGSLVGAGVDESEAHVYAEGVRRGGTLVTARVDESQRASVEDMLSRYSGVDAATRGSEYRAGGWERFDETAPAYTAGASPMLGAETTAAGGLSPTAGTSTLGARPTTSGGV
ncbi:MAG: hypothetical protein JOZ05_21990 [Acetobacteraceae bacterium]|nr:hypothetical protein [Acetobacteraceae bacterium]